MTALSLQLTSQWIAFVSLLPLALYVSHTALAHYTVYIFTHVTSTHTDSMVSSFKTISKVSRVSKRSLCWNSVLKLE